MYGKTGKIPHSDDTVGSLREPITTLHFCGGAKYVCQQLALNFFITTCKLSRCIMLSRRLAKFFPPLFLICQLLMLQQVFSTFFMYISDIKMSWDKQEFVNQSINYVIVFRFVLYLLLLQQLKMLIGETAYVCRKCSDKTHLVISTRSLSPPHTTSSPITPLDHYSLCMLTPVQYHLLLLSGPPPLSLP